MSPPGCYIVPNFIDDDQEAALLRTIDRQPWLSDLKRRVQHYGYRYDYRFRDISGADKLGEIPDWLSEIGRILVRNGHYSTEPDQVIINEYLPGQGIAAHIDRQHCFADRVATVSLGSQCVMRFENRQLGEKIDVELPPRSLAMITGDSRYNWTHAIAARKSDVIDGVRVPRRRRVSLTYRKVILAG